ncbi:MAG: glucokinase, partial [Gammaproteobacteria bacterium]|nr:glucokinase [Gammaproteobacteria bacterium]
MLKHFITWDLGATKCAAGLIEYDSITQALICKKSYASKLSAANSLEDLIKQIEIGLDFAMPTADAICIGAAGHYDGEWLLHTNPYPYDMHIGGIAKKQKWPAFAVIHDYASIICATFTAYMDQAENIKRLNDCPIKNQGRRVALGVGTGLGLKDGVLFANGDFWFGQNEIGHIGITHPPAIDNSRFHCHQALMQFLVHHSAEQTNSTLTFEKILTGQGMVNLYQFFYPDTSITTPEQVGLKIQEGKA